MEFEWDENKNLANIAKHKIDFNHVFSVFDDPFKIFFKDIKKHYNENRWNCIGYHKNGNLLFVTYTYRDEIIRIISARAATPRERRIYGDG